MRQHSIPKEPEHDDRLVSPLLARQDSLPKMPISPLEELCEKYLATVLPLLDPHQQAATKTAVATFLESEEGKHLWDVLQQYDAKEVNYMEHFYREIYTSYDGSNHSLNPNFTLSVDPALNTGPKRAAAFSYASAAASREKASWRSPLNEWAASAAAATAAHRASSPCPWSATVGDSADDSAARIGAAASSLKSPPQSSTGGRRVDARASSSGEPAPFAISRAKGDLVQLPCGNLGKARP